MNVIRVKLKEYLSENGLSAYQLGKEVEGMNEVTARLIASGTRKPSLESLDNIIKALRRLTGKKVKVSDLLEFVDGSEAEEEKNLTSRSVTIIQKPKRGDNRA
jgi:DNA-binding Xre family transcriptional regulator